jgi:hypothetical protein
MKEESQKHHPDPGGGVGMTSVLWKMTSTDSARNPSFFNFFRSVSTKAEVV